MRFYFGTSQLFPRSLRLRLATLCCIAMHGPLAAYIVWSIATGQVASGMALTLIAATIGSVVLAWAGIGTLLGPVDAPPSSPGKVDRSVAPTATAADEMIQSLYTGMNAGPDAAHVPLEAIQVAVHEDPLTGIANRRGFLSQIEALAPDLRRGTIAIVDIDHFKQIVDLGGHDEGDRILCAFAERLLGEIRRSDLAARWGGEEFIIFFAGSSEDEASWTLARVASKLRNRPIGEVLGRPISFSAGLSRWSSGELDDVLRFADQALYDAKLSGRDRICRACAV